MTGRQGSMGAAPDVWLGGDGILRIRFPENYHVDLDAVKWSNRRHRELCGDKRAVLIYADSVAAADYEAQQFASSEEAIEMVGCMAIIVRSFFTRAMADLFMKFHKPPYPTRMFNHENDAIEWLLEKWPDGA